MTPFGIAHSSHCYRVHHGARRFASSTQADSHGFVATTPEIECGRLAGRRESGSGSIRDMIGGDHAGDRAD